MYANAYSVTWSFDSVFCSPQYGVLEIWFHCLNCFLIWYNN